MVWRDDLRAWIVRVGFHKYHKRHADKAPPNNIKNLTKTSCEFMLFCIQGHAPGVQEPGVSAPHQEQAFIDPRPYPAAAISGTSFAPRRGVNLFHFIRISIRKGARERSVVVRRSSNQYQKNGYMEVQIK